MTEDRYELARVSAWELLELRRETAARDCADDAERALFANAALLAKSLRRGGKPIFPDAEAALRALGAGEINDLVEQYASIDGAAAAERFAGTNAAFDMARFERMKGGARA